MRRIAILGSTGSVGQSTLKVAHHLREEIQVIALSAKSNIDLLCAQAEEFHPKIVVIWEREKAFDLQKRLPRCKVLAGLDGLIEIATDSSIDCVVAAMSGTYGLLPTIAAIKAKKRIVLANKEVLVTAGALIMDLVQKYGVELLPIDSEHSALFQCLQGEDPLAVRRLILTASGGPFRTFSQEKLHTVTVEDALKHPTWSMGAKVSIDSSTLMNKGLEVIQAKWLFNMAAEKIDVIIHPQSIVQSMVEFLDGSLKAQIGKPNLYSPIQYALSFPQRRPGFLPSFDFSKIQPLEFFQPDTIKFVCLRLAFDALREGGTLACYMNAANEILVERFLNKEISWDSIGKKLESLMQSHSIQKEIDLDTILAIDALARQEAKEA